MVLLEKGFEKDVNHGGDVGGEAPTESEGWVERHGAWSLAVRHASVSCPNYKEASAACEAVLGWRVEEETGSLRIKGVLQCLEPCFAKL